MMIDPLCVGICIYAIDRPLRMFPRCRGPLYTWISFEGCNYERVILTLWIIMTKIVAPYATRYLLEPLAPTMRDLDI